MINFPTQIIDYESESPALLDLFIYDASICSTMASAPLGYSDHVAASVSIDFPLNSKWDAKFYHIAYDYSCANWGSLHDHLRDAPWKDIVKLSVSATVSKFCEWVQIGTDVSIPHCKYQVKSHSSPRSSTAWATAIVHRNHCFCLCQQNKSSESNLKFRQASNHWKKVLEAAKLAYANKTKDLIPSLKR